MEPQDRRVEQAVVPSSESASKRRHAMRLLRDEHEAIVLVYELTGLHDSDPRVLVLEWAGGTTVCLNHYPANWRELKDPALLALRPQKDS